MAQITLTLSNSKNVAAISENPGYLNRVGALVYEHALNLLDNVSNTTRPRSGGWNARPEETGNRLAATFRWCLPTNRT